MPSSADPGASSETSAAVAALPATLTEIRAGRSVAVHVRRNDAAKVRLVFVHGSCASMLPYRDVMEHFAATHEIVAFDHLGCGRSPKPRDWYAYRSSELTADLAALLRRYATTDKKNVVVAHSAGCSFSLAVAAEAPDLPLAGLCLLGAFHAERMPVHPVFYLPVFVLNLLQPTLSAGFEAVALHATTRQGETAAHRSVRALCAELNASNEMHMCKAYYRQLSVPSADAVRRVAAARLPVSLLVGEADALIPRAATDALHALLPEAEVRVIARASHQMMQENPTDVCAGVADLVARATQ